MARKGVTISNETNLRSDDLRRLVYAAMDEADLQGDFEVIFRHRPRARTQVSTSQMGSSRRYVISIPKALQARDKLKELARALGVHLVWASWRVKGVKMQPPWDWGDKFELRLQEDKEPWAGALDRMNRIVQDREDKARTHVTRLEAKLAKLEVDKKRTLKLLKKWQKKVRYYEKRQSKAVQEADFMVRLKQKTRALNKEENA